MRHRFTALATILLAAQAAWAEAVEYGPLFADDSVIELTLEGPLSSTLDDREAREERAFSLRTGADGVPLEVRVRGKSRARICRFAPLRLDFESGSTAGTVFAGQDKLKLVLPCHDSDRAERDVLEEYAAYRIFNLLSDRSYRVRPLRVRFVDAEQPGEPPVMVRYAFVLESDEELSARIGLPEAQIQAVRRSELQADQAATVFIFQYLVGNTDWSLVTADGEEWCCHNLRLFGGVPDLYAVPYDFDLAGLVDAKYAKPDASLRIRSVTQRQYRGYCIDAAALGPALARITAQRAAILAVPGSLPLLDEKQSKTRVRFLEGFFEQAEDPQDLLEQFGKRCL
ncbi:MAG: hypothetical protein R3233_01905 [Xanthomonadales bacterium]|nr:hypothetical protein [Xanthomonadales bacterium]